MKNDFPSLNPFMHRVEAFFTDVDGTLVDNEGPALDQIGEENHRWVRGCISPKVDPDIKAKGFGNIRPFAGNPLETIREILSKRANVEIPASVDDKIRRLRENSPALEEVVEAIPPIAQFMAYAKQLGRPIMAVTSSERDRATRYIERAGLGSREKKTGLLFSLPKDLISAHSDCGPHLHKPEPDCYHLAVKKLGVDPARCLTFEDSLGGGKAAYAAGIPFIGVLIGNHISAAEMQDKSEQLRQLGAINIISRPADTVPVLREVLQSYPARPLHAAKHTQLHLAG